jgi:hypothetical protein
MLAMRRSGMYALFFLVLILLIPLTAWSKDAKYVLMNLSWT